MKKTLFLFALIMGTIFMAPDAIAKVNRQKVTFYVYLHCDGCVQKVMKNIAYEKGVKDIVCSIPNQTVEVTYDANKTTIEQLQEAFAKIGKPASLTPVKEHQDDPNAHDHHHNDNHNHNHGHSH